MACGSKDSTLTCGENYNVTLSGAGDCACEQTGCQ
jgi:hypothetical protein